jgi:hypothetical protein
MFGAIDWFLRDGYWIIEGRKINNIAQLMLTKVERNGLIEATRDGQVLVIPRQPTNELLSPDGFRF